MIARAGSETTTTTTATTRTTTLTATNTTMVKTMTTTTTTTTAAHDGPGRARPLPPPTMPPEKEATAVQYDDLTGGDVGGGESRGQKAVVRPSVRPSARPSARLSIHPSCDSVVGEAPLETSERSLAVGASRNTSNQSKYCITTHYATKSPRHEGGTETFYIHLTSCDRRREE